MAADAEKGDQREDQQIRRPGRDPDERSRQGEDQCRHGILERDDGDERILPRTLAQQGQRKRVEQRRGNRGHRAEQVETGRADPLAQHHHNHAEKADGEADHGVAADDLAEDQPAEQRQEQRREERKGDGLGQRQGLERVEEGRGRQRSDAAAQEVGADRLARGARRPEPQPEGKGRHRTEQEAQEDELEGRIVDADMLEQRIHHAEDADAENRDKNRVQPVDDHPASAFSET